MADAKVYTATDVCLGGRNGPLIIGVIKFHPQAVAWKANNDQAKSNVITIEKERMKRAQWIATSSGYELKIVHDFGVEKFNGFTRGADKTGFDTDDYKQIKYYFENHYDVPLQNVKASCKGWNWGKAEVDDKFVTFIVGDDMAFELPKSAIASSRNQKNEVTIEFAPDPKLKGMDEPKVQHETIVEMRIAFPAAKRGETDDQDEKTGDADSVDEVDEAAEFVRQTKSEAETKVLIGELIVSFKNLQCITPRGRFDVDMFPTYLRLQGKSFDYTLQYEYIVQCFLLAKPGQREFPFFVIQLNKPVHQGQTRYPMLVLQLNDDDLELNLKMDEKELNERYEGRLQKSYEGFAHEIISNIFKTITGKKLTGPDTFRSFHQQEAIRCTGKNGETFLYPLAKGFLAIPRPAIYVDFANVSGVEFNRVSAGSRTFDFKILKKGSRDAYQFSSLARDDYEPLIDFIKSKNVKILNDGKENDSAPYMEKDNDDRRKRPRMDDSDDEDGDEDESEDNDYRPEDDSEEDVSASGSDDDEEDDASGSEDEDSRPSKKRSRHSESENEDDESSEDNRKKAKKTEGSKKSSSNAEPKKTAPAKKPEAKKDAGSSRSASAFMLFSKAMRSKAAQENPNASFGELAKILGAMWKSASDAEKKPFYEQEKALAEEKKKELAKVKSNT